MYVRLGAFQNKQIPKWALKSESMLHGPTGPTWPLDVQKSPEEPSRSRTTFTWRWHGGSWSWDTRGRAGQTLGGPAAWAPIAAPIWDRGGEMATSQINSPWRHQGRCGLVRVNAGCK